MPEKERQHLMKTKRWKGKIYSTNLLHWLKNISPDSPANKRPVIFYLPLTSDNLICTQGIYIKPTTTME